MTMNRAIAVVSAMSIATLAGSAPIANADPAPTFVNAWDAVNTLQSWGYTIGLGGQATDGRYLQLEALSKCEYLGMNPVVNEPAADNTFQVVYLTIRCSGGTANGGVDLPPETITQPDTGSSTS